MSWLESTNWRLFSAVKPPFMQVWRKLLLKVNTIIRIAVSKCESTSTTTPGQDRYSGLSLTHYLKLDQLSCHSWITKKEHIHLYETKWSAGKVQRRTVVSYPFNQVSSCFVATLSWLTLQILLPPLTSFYCFFIRKWYWFALLSTHFVIAVTLSIGREHQNVLRRLKHTKTPLRSSLPRW